MTDQPTDRTGVNAPVWARLGIDPKIGNARIADKFFERGEQICPGCTRYIYCSQCLTELFDAVQEMTGKSWRNRLSGWRSL
jgi:hypothetical protein